MAMHAIKCDYTTLWPAVNLMECEQTRGEMMPYFSSKQDQLERGAKIAADIACAVLLALFSIVFFGWVGGLLAFAIIEVCLLSIDWLVPNDDDNAGTAIR